MKLVLTLYQNLKNMKNSGGGLSDKQQNLAESWHAQGPGAIAFLNKSPLQHAYDENARINAETDARRKMLQELAFDLAQIDDGRF